jgi:hypothetical protein
VVTVTAESPPFAELLTVVFDNVYVQGAVGLELDWEHPAATEASKAHHAIRYFLQRMRMGGENDT